MKQINPARRLRKRETEAEQVLWSWLRNRKLNGVKFRRQQPVGKYIVDFISFENKLIIELDGGQHNEDRNEYKDKIRAEWLESQGFQVVRFWNNEVRNNLEDVITKIKEVVESGSPSP